MTGDHDLIDPMSAHAEVQRIDKTAAQWFSAVLLAVSLPVAGLFVSGWRPEVLPEGLGFVWWIGVALVGLSLAAIGYAGCPVYWGSVTTARAQKSFCIRFGLVAFLAGAILAMVAVLLSA